MALIPTTWDPAKKNASVTLSGGNLTAYSTDFSVYSVFGATAGLYYFEVGSFAGPDSLQRIGVSGVTLTTTSRPGDSDTVGYWRSNGLVYANSVVKDTLASVATTVGIKLDASARKVSFSVNGVWSPTAIDVPGSSAIYAMYGNAFAATANFGASSFLYPVPSGYAAGFGVTPPYYISGVVKDHTGAPAARLVRAYNRTSGTLSGATTSNPDTGEYIIAVPDAGAHTVVFLDDEVGPVLNALVLDRVQSAE